MKLVDEAITFYKKRIDERPCFESIRHLTPWKQIGEGDKHVAVVEKMKNGVPTVYMIRGKRYVCDNKSTFKGARA
ncbi:hypothetical protein ACFQ3W_25590 [Paenibacillus puldeungensis]|uniref:Uncharacterized protein n=2 Tax=Paenibacillus puldeungensis TaxID=696536 RepID=A0ABW3S6K0_9BACL